MDGGLEECDRWNSETVNPEYEEYKCKVLRVHASIKDGKCTCDDQWKGEFSIHKSHMCVKTQTFLPIKNPSTLVINPSFFSFPPDVFHILMSSLCSLHSSFRS